MGRPRKQSVKVREYIARRGGESKHFSSRTVANGWVGRGKVEPFRIVVEDYELCAERIPGANDDINDPSSWTRVRLFESLFRVQGTASTNESSSQLELRLRTEASARREASYDICIGNLTNENIRLQNHADFPPTARRFALERVEAHFQRLDMGIGRFEEREKVEQEHRRLQGLPTLSDLHKMAVDADFKTYRIGVGTADNARSFAGPWLYDRTDLRLNLVPAHEFKNWLKDELARSEGGSKRLKSAIGEIKRIYKYLVRHSELSQYKDAFSVEALHAEMNGIIRPVDGTFIRRTLSADEIESLLRVCQDDFERAVIALPLVGMRTRGEVAGLSWADITLELGSHWIKVEHTVVVTKGGKLNLELPKDVVSRKRKDRMTHRHYPVSARLMNIIEPLRGNGKYVLGIDDKLVRPDIVSDLQAELLTRAGLKSRSVVGYSLRHTVLDATEEFAGRVYKDLLHRGDDDRSTANTVYTHGDATRFRRRLLLPNGQTCADVLPWALLKG